MKSSTKGKILDFVRKILKIKDFTPYIDYTRVDVIRVQVRQQFDERDMSVLGNDELKFHMGLAILSEIQKNNFIDISIDPPLPGTTHSTITGTLFIAHKRES